MEQRKRRLDRVRNQGQVVLKGVNPIREETVCGWSEKITRFSAPRSRCPVHPAISPPAESDLVLFPAVSGIGVGREVVGRDFSENVESAQRSR